MKKKVILSCTLIIFVFFTTVNSQEIHIINSGYIKGSHKNIENFFDKHYKYDNTLTVFVDQPVPSKRDAVSKDDFYKAGHTFIRLQYYEKDFYGNKIEKVIYRGFYPTNQLTMEQIIELKEVNGYINSEDSLDFPEWDHKWDIGKVYIIDSNNIKKVIDYIDNFTKNNMTFHTLTNNCTSFAVNALTEAGVKSDIVKHRPIFALEYECFIKSVGYDLDNMFCYCAGDAGEDLRETGKYLINNGNEVQEINKTKMWFDKLKQYLREKYLHSRNTLVDIFTSLIKLYRNVLN